jgi:hypothetical protein
MTAILALIALALALPWTRIGWQGGGRALIHLICCCHGHCHWCHLCLHLQDDGGKDDGRNNRQGCTANIQGWEEVGHRDPISVEHGNCGGSLAALQHQQRQMSSGNHAAAVCSHSGNKDTGSNSIGGGTDNNQQSTESGGGNGDGNGSEDDN